MATLEDLFSTAENLEWEMFSFPDYILCTYAYDASRPGFPGQDTWAVQISRGQSVRVLISGRDIKPQFVSVLTAIDFIERVANQYPRPDLTGTLPDGTILTADHKFTSEVTTGHECICSTGNPEDYYGPSQDCPQHGILDLLTHAGNVSAWMDRSGVSSDLKMLKITEEAGEAAAAYIGLIGANPRKGVTNTNADVANELIDVAVTALVALSDFTDDPRAFVQEYIGRRGPRLAALTEPEICGGCGEPRNKGAHGVDQEFGGCV